MSDPEINRYLKIISRAENAEDKNNKIYLKNKKFFFQKSLFDEDINMLVESERACFTFNEFAPIGNQFFTQIADASPSVTLKNDQNPDMASFLTDRIQKVWDDNDQSILQAQASIEAIFCGKSVIKLKSDYKNTTDFEQKIVMTRCPRPDMIFFDPDSKKVDKSDSEFVIEKMKMTKKAILDQFPDVEFSDRDPPDKKYTIHFMYEYEEDEKTIYLLDTGEIVDEKPEDKESIKASRVVPDNKKVVWKAFLNKKIVDEGELNTSVLPYFQLTGSSYFTEDGLRIVSFFEPAIDAQRAKNLMANYFISDSMSLFRSTFLIEEQTVTDESLRTLKDFKTRHLLIYKSLIKDGGETIQLPPPQIVQPPPIPQEYMQIFESMSSSIDKIMGSYNQAVVHNDVSGVGMYKLSHFLSSMLRPYTSNLLLALKSITKCMLSFLKTIDQPVYLGDTNQLSDDFDWDAFDYIIEEGVNFKLQQEATLETLLKMSQVYPAFAQFINTAGIPFIIENLSLVNKNKILEEFEQWQQQQKQQAAQQPPSPQQMIAQARMMEAQTKQQSAALDSQSQTNDAMVKLHELQSKEEIERLKLLLAQEQQQNEDYRAKLEFLHKQLGGYHGKANDKTA